MPYSVDGGLQQVATNHVLPFWPCLALGVQLVSFLLFVGRELHHSTFLSTLASVQGVYTVANSPSLGAFCATYCCVVCEKFGVVHVSSYM